VGDNYSNKPPIRSLKITDDHLLKKGDLINAEKGKYLEIS
jgi:hypothetical protein